jgi:translation initiation factor IF-2
LLTFTKAEVMNLQSRVVDYSEGTVIEGSIDKKQGICVNALVQHGIIKVGDYIVAGSSFGRIKRLVSDSGLELKEADPSTPVQVIIIWVCKLF